MIGDRALALGAFSSVKAVLRMEIPDIGMPVMFLIVAYLKKFFLLIRLCCIMLLLPPNGEYVTYVDRHILSNTAPRCG
jgi:hypothetical protein